MISVITDGLIYNKNIVQPVGNVPASIDILAYFTEHNVPKTGLTPTIRIRQVSDNALIVEDEVMTEVGEGFYKYTVSSVTDFEKYTVRCYGGASLPVEEQYVYDGFEAVVKQNDGVVL
jgi:hypothetical protein